MAPWVCDTCLVGPTVKKYLAQPKISSDLRKEIVSILVQARLSRFCIDLRKNTKFCVEVENDLTKTAATTISRFGFETSPEWPKPGLFGKKSTFPEWVATMSWGSQNSLLTQMKSYRVQDDPRGRVRTQTTPRTQNEAIPRKPPGRVSTIPNSLTHALT